MKSTFPIKEIGKNVSLADRGGCEKSTTTNGERRTTNDDDDDDDTTGKVWTLNRRALDAG